MRVHILSLPPELLIRILSNLALADLTACLRTNRALYALISESTLLQYHIELEAACAQDNLSQACTTPLVDRLKLLKQRERAWREVKPSRTVSVPVKHRPSGIYDLTGGVYLLGEASRNATRPTRALQYIKLPSLNEDVSAGVKWRRIDVQKDVIDIGFALAEHDLIAVVTQQPGPNVYDHAISIQLLQFSKSSPTPFPHPLASEPNLFVRYVTRSIGHCSIAIEIVGDILVLLLTFPFAGGIFRDELFAFDWKKGELRQTLDAEWLTYATFAFLSHDTLVLPNMNENSLELYRLDLTPKSSSSAPPDRLKPAVCLRLPELNRECGVIRVSCRGEPNPFGPPPPPSDSERDSKEKEKKQKFTLPPDPRPFHDAPEDAIIIFNLLIQDAGPIPIGHVHSVSFVVHRSALVGVMEKQEAADAAREREREEEGKEMVWRERETAVEEVGVEDADEDEDVHMDDEHEQDHDDETDTDNPIPSDPFALSQYAILPIIASPSRDSSPTTTLPTPPTSSPGLYYPPGRPLPYSDWGPAITRWFATDDAPTRWITTTAGQRYVSVCEDVGGPITVRDFGAGAVRRERARVEKEADKENQDEETDEEDTWRPSAPPWRTSHPPKLVDGGYERLNPHVPAQLFAEEVLSGLPYVESQSGECYEEYAAVLMDEERMVGMKMMPIDEQPDRDRIVSLDILNIG